MTLPGRPPLYKYFMKQAVFEGWNDTTREGWEKQMRENNTLKNILLVVPALHQGGFEKVCVMTARLLQPHFQVTIAVFDGSDLIFDVTGLDVVDLKLPSSPGRIGKILNVFKRAGKLKKLKTALRIDLAYGFGPTANLSNVMGKSREIIYSGMRSYLDLLDLRRLQFYAVKSDRLICCSALIAGEIARRFPEKPVSVLYNPYNLGEICKKAGEDREKLPWESRNGENIPLLVSMGREDDVKGYWHLIKAFAEIKRRGYPAHLMIIGEGTFQEYKKLAEDLGVLQDVFFTGVRRNPYPYLKEADIYVLSSLNEGFPNALVEAMALSVPVIATNCKSGPAEILLKEYREVSLKNYMDADYGILLPEPGREKNLDPGVLEQEEIIMAEAVISFLRDSERGKYYGEQARFRAAEFSDTAYAEKLSKMMQEDCKV